MKKIVLTTVLAAGFLVTTSAQAHTEDALLGGLLGVAVGASISNHSHPHVVHHYDHRPVRHVYHSPPRHVHHHHPHGKAKGYWRKHDKHHRYHGRRDWRDHDWDDDRGRRGHRRH